MTDDKPMKSAYELAMERLKKQDEAAGIEHKPLTGEQRAAIADIRTVYQAKLAELEILHQSSLRATPDPAERLRLEEDYQRERQRLTAERESKIGEAQQA